MIQKVVHLEPWEVREASAIRALPIPRPFVHQMRRELAFKHLHNILAQHGEEFVAVEGAACGYI